MTSGVAPRPDTLLVASLFAGAGGFDLGVVHLALAGRAATVLYVERDAYAAASLVARMEDEALDPAPVWDDVATFDARPWRGLVDLVIGGFPCQDISVAGDGAGIIDGERSGLWREMARIVGDLGPRYVFVENVSRLRSLGLDVVLGDLAALGYDAAWGCYLAADVGAPHKRERLFVLAQRVPDAERDAIRQLTERRERGPALGPDSESGILGSGVGLAHPEHPRRSERSAPHDDDGGDAHGHEPHRCDPDVPGVGLADPGGARREGFGAPGAAADHPRWPPGPEDTDRWNAVLAVWPGLSPAVAPGGGAGAAQRLGAGASAQPEFLGVADGLADRVERLHSIGNGVVPAVAARAFVELAAALAGAE